MVKKTYIIPSSLTVQLSSRDAQLQTISANSASTGLDGTTFGGNTSSASIGPEGADVKENKSVWDEEW